VNRTLTSLYLQWNNFGDEGAAAIGDALKVCWQHACMHETQANRTITTLFLNWDNRDGRGAAVICEALKVARLAVATRI